MECIFPENAHICRQQIGRGEKQETWEAICYELKNKENPKSSFHSQGVRIHKSFLEKESNILSVVTCLTIISGTDLK